MKQATIIAAAILAGCATNPNKIESAYVSPQRYAGYDCYQLAVETVAVTQRRDELYKRLERERKNDNAKMGAGLLIFWPTLFFISGDGPESAEYAQIKGEYDALELLSAELGCGGAL